ncbi:hypothetical protein FNV43_RR09744 [Rhamnella rubrinervis]|uniref:Laccase n=1 Tax=Rhamnella rubrinervis TaxID=2594499 RepID=A0A8K0HB06_9ROSA|nr:hypothetical protein FNV43_RR09546 [Rhamnella rubrinervis]KAF3449020.1 hypothetical protein FNV43_RR09744 [Rhamnella rubrinervis]
MERFVFLIVACAFALLASNITSTASATIVEHSFFVKNLTVNRLCNEQVITAVNGSLPGPTLLVKEGDKLVVHVFNESPYNVTIHWHGVLQLLSAWADGPAYVTQCPIQPGQSYTYKFKIIGQEGTLWWHAHFSWLRATVYGALLIRPRSGQYSYPFSTKPYKEIPILLGEWWNANVVDVENEGLLSGLPPNNSDAYTINGLPGDLYPCSENQTYRLNVVRGKTYMLRIINAALNNQLFYKIANHNMTVVAIDAGYTQPYFTDVVVVAPGHTTDVLVTFDQPIGSYYMAARPYASTVPAIDFANTTTRGLIVYEGDTSSTSPPMPELPDFADTPTAHKFYTNLTGLAGGPHWVPVPLDVDEHMFVTIGVNLELCNTCAGGQRLSASMNNESFDFPSTLSMLEAFANNVSGIYTTDFPDEPPVRFDYTNLTFINDPDLIFTQKSTKAKKLKFNSTVEMVLQNTAFIGIENHPIHIHGFNFHVLAQGFGNYDVVNGPKSFNLVNPQIRNTVAVPVGGWAVVRFQANNPGVWLVHCHLDVHLPWGLAMAFEVENGPTPSSTLPPPPADLPKC